MDAKWTFLECQQCQLRLPLDLAQYSGKFCPRCGGEMRVDITSNPGIQPPRVPARREISLLLDNIRSAHNLGAIFRSADGAGVQRLYLCGITPRPDENAAIRKTALGAEKSLAWEYHPNAPRLLQSLMHKPTTVLALESTTLSSSLFDYTPPAGPLLLIAGNEAAGVDPALLQAAHAALHLPMQGLKGSLNVAEALSIALYHLSFAV